MRNLNKYLEDVDAPENEIKAVASTISHELRTPLNAIIGFSDLIQEVESIKDIRSFAKIIELNGSMLLKKITSIIDFSVLDYYSDLCLEEINVNKLVQDVYNNFINEAEYKHSVRVEIKTKDNDDSLIIYSDRTKIEKILTNLLSNSLKFTNEGCIEIGYEVIKSNDSNARLLIYVSDTGIGIPEDKQNIIFKPFRQVDESYCADLEGLGIGLAICDKLSKIINGRLRLESALNKGSLFTLELPIDNLFARQNIIRVKNVLIVEENEVNYFELKDCLNKKSFNVMRTCNVDNLNGLINAIANLDYVIINSGIEMFENAFRIRSLHEKYPQITFIVQTLEYDGLIMFESRYDNLHFINTPLNKEEFKELLNNCLAKKMVLASG